jgi:hypothetical protein
VSADADHPLGRVSVALSTHNGARHLPEQLASLVDQTVRPAELVVRDDGSSDDTLAILQSFATTAPFPVVVLSGANVGLTESMAEVLGHCTGDLVALCDQDDRWLAPKLERLAAAIDARSERSAAVGDGWLVGRDGDRRPGTTFAALGFTPKRKAQFQTDPIRVLAFRSVLPGHAAVFRRSVVDAALPFPASLSSTDLVVFPDRWLSLVAGGLGPVAVIDEPLVAHRQHDAQQTGVDARRIVLAARAARRAARQLVGSGPATRRRILARAAVLADAASRTDGRSLAAAATHLERRGALPRARSARVRPILAELRSGGYRWSGGAAVAVADLLRPLR